MQGDAASNKNSTLTPKVCQLNRSEPSSALKAKTEVSGLDHQWAALWSRVHLAVLQTILQFQFIPQSLQQDLFILTEMQQNVKDIAILMTCLPVGLSEDALTTSTDFLLQHLQVSLATGAFHCKPGN